MLDTHLDFLEQISTVNILCLQDVFKTFWKHVFRTSTFRSTRSQMFFKVGILKTFANFSIKYKCFTLKFAKFFRAPVFLEHLCWLLLYFAKLETEFREIIYSRQINEISLHEILSSYTLFIGFFLFQHKLHHSPTYNHHGNSRREGRSRCSNRDESFGYDSNNASM